EQAKGGGQQVEPPVPRRIGGGERLEPGRSEHVPPLARREIADRQPDEDVLRERIERVVLPEEGQHAEAEKERDEDAELLCVHHALRRRSAATPVAAATRIATTIRRCASVWAAM